MYESECELSGLGKSLLLDAYRCGRSSSLERSLDRVGPGIERRQLGHALGVGQYREAGLWQGLSED